MAAMLAVLVLSTAADLGSKAWAERELSVERRDNPALCQLDEQGYRQMQRLRRESIVLVEGWVELRYAENCGAAFSMLADSSPWVRGAVFYGSAGVFISVLLWMFVQGQGGALFALSVPLLISGAVGNLVDRVRLGYVVDFIRVFHEFDSGHWEYPTFNIADVAIFVGAVLWLLDGIRKPSPVESAEPTAKVAAS